MNEMKTGLTFFLFLTNLCIFIHSQSYKFKVIAFWNASTSPVEHEEAHEIASEQANAWFSQAAINYSFFYNTTQSWNDMNDKFLSNYDVILLLDARPEDLPPRNAYERFMDRGGATIIFHYAGFVLDCSEIPNNWTWYHNILIGSGQFVQNTWEPSDIMMHVENVNHPVTKGLNVTFRSTPNEWYSWQTDLRGVPTIDILLTMDLSTFPVGTQSGNIFYPNFYPVAWTNKNYNMIYVNWCHPYISDDHSYISDCYASVEQNQFMLNSIIWLGSKAVADILKNLSSQI